MGPLEYRPLQHPIKYSEGFYNMKYLANVMFELFHFYDGVKNYLIEIIQRIDWILFSILIEYHHIKKYRGKR